MTTVRAWARVAVGTVAALACCACGAAMLAMQGDERDLRADAESPVPPGDPTVLVIAIDGVPRALLYELIDRGQLPALRAILGGPERGTLAHAHLDDTLLSTLPSSTLAAWASIFTGATPAEHGVAGNEYFARETRTLAAPAPVSIGSMDPVTRTYTEDYADDLLAVPTIYERLRQRDASFSAWVAVSQFHRGADRLMLADASIAVEAFGALIAGTGDDDANLDLYATLDREAVETVIEALADRPAPKMITLYLTGTDHYAHGSTAGPEAALRRYLVEVIDPLFARLRSALDDRGALDDRAVVVVSDHGHTAVEADDAHALSTGDGPDDPPAVLRGAGFRLRPFELEVDASADFDAVITYGGAMAYAYVADRSTCPRAGTTCDWARPARYEEDVLPLADAFFRASEDGTHAPGMRGTLDLVLVRRPVPLGEDARPFEVYVGDGRVEPLDRHLAAHPRRHYVAVESRLRDLAVGPYGHHAGDVLLLARNGDEEDPADRYYFAGRYRSWHGSPSRADSEVPLIVAQRGRTPEELGRRVRAVLGREPRQADVARVIEALLEHDPPPDHDRAARR